MIRDRIIEHWQSFKNPLINDILINLETLESTHFAPLTEEDEDSIGHLLDHLKQYPANDLDELKLIKLLNQLPAAYMLFLIHRLQNDNTDLVMKLINYAQKFKSKDPEVTCFFQRNMVFEKSQLLGRIFSSSRMEAVLSVLKDIR
jgi:hypothetical protein